MLIREKGLLKESLPRRGEMRARLHAEDGPSTCLRAVSFVKTMKVYAEHDGIGGIQLCM